MCQTQDFHPEDSSCVKKQKTLTYYLNPNHDLNLTKLQCLFTTLTMCLKGFLTESPEGKRFLSALFWALVELEMLITHFCDS